MRFLASRTLRSLAVATLALAVSACAPAAPQRCHRYDALSLTPDNGFAASFEWLQPLSIDALPERIEIALTVVRPIKRPIELVHVVADREADRWILALPDVNNSLSAICWVTPRGGLPNCGAEILEVPYSPAGYYYLRPNGNEILEAGLSFYLCK